MKRTKKQKLQGQLRASKAEKRHFIHLLSIQSFHIFAQSLPTFLTLNRSRHPCIEAGHEILSCLKEGERIA